MYQNKQTNNKNKLNYITECESLTYSNETCYFCVFHVFVVYLYYIL